MNKDIFEDIEVPSFEAKHAIKRGIQKGVQEQDQVKKSTKNKIIKILLPIAAVITLTLSLGLVSEPIAQAVSNIPIIGEALGGFYDQYAVEHGSDDRLPDPEQIEETSLVATDQGITVEITGAYNYQNGTVGIIFEASGDIHNEDEMFFEGPDNACQYYLFDHQEADSQNIYTTHLDGFNKVGDTYVGNITINFFDDSYPDTIETIPLTFTSMCAKEGEWSFDIPVVDDPNTVALDIEQSGHGVTIYYDSIYLGDTESSLYFTVTEPNLDNVIVIGGMEERIRFTFVDDKGNEIHYSSIDDSSVGMTDGYNTYTCELTFSSPIPADCESITVNVELVTESGETVALDPVELDIKK